MTDGHTGAQLPASFGVNYFLFLGLFKQGIGGLLVVEPGLLTLQVPQLTSGRRQSVTHSDPELALIQAWPSGGALVLLRGERNAVAAVPHFERQRLDVCLAAAGFRVSRRTRVFPNPQFYL